MAKRLNEAGQIFKNRSLPITWIVRCHSYYIRIFEIEDSDGWTPDEGRERGQKQRAYDSYMERMFLDDKDTLNGLYMKFNQSILTSGTYKEFCDYLRDRGYEIKSKDNATKKQVKQCEDECTANWKKWKAYKNSSKELGGN